MKFLAALTFLYTFTPSFATPYYGEPLSLSQRPNANVAPRPLMPMFTVSQDVRPTGNGTELPAYSTIYYFNQVSFFFDTLSKLNSYKFGSSLIIINPSSEHSDNVIGLPANSIKKEDLSWWAHQVSCLSYRLFSNSFRLGETNAEGVRALKPYSQLI